MTKDGIREKTLTPMRAMRAKCMECSNFKWSEVRDCEMKDCPLWVYRLGKNPTQ